MKRHCRYCSGRVRGHGYVGYFSGEHYCSRWRRMAAGGWEDYGDAGKKPRQPARAA